MRILVTGGAGFIGSAVVRRAIGEGDEVLVLDKLTYAGNLASLAPVAASSRYAFVRADIGDRRAVKAALERFRPESVLHLAAESHVDRSIDAPAAFIETNVMGTFVMLSEALAYWRTLRGAASEGFRFLQVSTDEVFGSLGAEGSFSEDSPYRPNSPYSASKASADHLARAWRHTYGLPTLLTNCSNNYGPYHFPEKLIPLMIINALEGLPLPVYGRGENVRDWLFVEDHAEVLLEIVRAGRAGESYNIGGGSERRNLEVVETICDLVDELASGRRRGSRRDLISYVQDRPGHDLRYAIDEASKIAREIGWRRSARKSSKPGCAKTLRWYLDNPDWWWRDIRSGAYRGRAARASGLNRPLKGTGRGSCEWRCKTPKFPGVKVIKPAKHGDLPRLLLGGLQRGAVASKQAGLDLTFRAGQSFLVGGGRHDPWFAFSIASVRAAQTRASDAGSRARRRGGSQALFEDLRPPFRNRIVWGELGVAARNARRFRAWLLHAQRTNTTRCSTRSRTSTRPRTTSASLSTTPRSRSTGESISRGPSFRKRTAVSRGSPIFLSFSTDRACA